MDSKIVMLAQPEINYFHRKISVKLHPVAATDTLSFWLS